MLGRFKLAKSFIRVVGKRIPMRHVTNRGPIGYGKGLVLVSNKFSGACQEGAKVTKCALACGSCKLALSTRRPFS